jgi:hypothetical protein
VPRFWEVSRAHDVANGLEHDVVRRAAQDADFIFHIDPCRSAYCASCRVEPCPVRAAPFTAERAWTVDALVREPPP